MEIIKKEAMNSALLKRLPTGRLICLLLAIWQWQLALGTWAALVRWQLDRSNKQTNQYGRYVGMERWVWCTHAGGQSPSALYGRGQCELIGACFQWQWIRRDRLLRQVFIDTSRAPSYTEKLSIGP